MRESLRVNIKREIDDSYDIVIGKGLFPHIAADLKASPLGHRYVVISDANVMKLYGLKLLEMLREQGLSAERLAFPAGEKSKNRRILRHLENGMLELGLGRDTAVIACGGGVTGDMAGFLASIYHRGIPYIQVPTTLLAMVDAAVGGKTGINAAQGKNLLGSFYQPKRVYMDLTTLSTLPRRQYLAGLAEVVKHAVIRDREFFGFLESNKSAILEMEPNILARLVKANCALKAEVVSQDERESNLRKILNYGHTLGHAIEAITEYSLLHGEAVALGMALEGRLACDLKILPEHELERQNSLLRGLGLPISAKLVLKGLLGRIPKARELVEFTHADKKVRKGRVEYVFPVRIGRVKQVSGQIGVPVDDLKVLHTLNQILH